MTPMQSVYMQTNAGCAVAMAFQRGTAIAMATCSMSAARAAAMAFPLETVIVTATWTGMEMAFAALRICARTPLPATT